ncbi:NUDIX hydrolase [Patescibacteria group bacterium]|nr:NUDIX hydrolase [Patescibacteria group bacterium]
MTKATLTRHIKELKKRKPPLLVVNAVIQKGEEVLLLKRAKEPHKGTWVVPGGHVKHNEDLETAVKREVREETGLDIKVIGTVCTHRDDLGIDPRGFHLAVTFLTTPINGKIRKNKEAMAIKWFKLNRLPKNLGLGCEIYFQKTIMREQQVSELVKYAPPMPMVNQIIYKDATKVLLCKRNKPPYYSEWIIPGGHFSFKETIEEASIRKAREETGLEVEVEKVIDVSTDYGVDPRSVNVLITHLCKYKSGRTRPSKDVSEFYWHDISKPLPSRIDFTHPVVLRVIDKAKKYLLSSK